MFNNFRLSPGAQLYIFNEEKTMLKGPISSKQNNSKNIFSTGPIKGRNIFLYLFEPSKTSSFESKISINRIIIGLKDIFKNMNHISPNASTNCMLDAECLTNFEDLKSAEAILFTNSGGQCSGTILNDEAQDMIPYFLTAFHCLDSDGDKTLSQAEKDATAFYSFWFHYSKQACNGPNPSTWVEFDGSDFRSAWESSDFALLELQHTPTFADGINYAGWDRSGNLPAGYLSGSLHHPQGAFTKISITRNVINSLLFSHHFAVYWSNGATDVGSSGCALIDENDKVVGHLHKGLSNCDFTNLVDQYGKFSDSWLGGGTNNTQLKHWLSPNQNLNNTAVLLLNPLTIKGPTQITCTNSGVYSVPDISCASYTWNVSPTLSIVNGQGTHSVTVAKGPYGNSFAGSVSVTITGCAGSTSVTKDDITVDYLSGTYHGNDGITHTLYTANGTKIGETTIIVNYPGATSYTWERTSGNASWGSLLNTCDFILSAQNPSITLKVTAHTSCGDVFRYISFYVSSYYQVPSFNVYPNPTKGTINISLNEVDTSSKRATSMESLSNFEIEIYDTNGKLLKKVIRNTPYEILNISSLSPGFYIVKIIYGGHIESHKVLLQN